MCAGGRMSVLSPPKKSEFSSLKRAPISKPSFTLGDMKKAIPPHCFQRSLFRSFSYIIFDCILISLFYYVATTYIDYLPQPSSFVAWAVYWVVQGCVMTGLWVIAHDCGHHAFSDYPWVDNTVGFILHSSLLVPYFSWKYSHRRQHSNCGSLERDEVFVPKKRSSIKWWAKYFNNPPGRFITVTVQLTLGWPLYLMFNVSGKPDAGVAYHYNPHDPIYNDRERLQIYVSDVGILAVTYGLYRIALAKGLAWVICIYGVPLLVANAFLVTITYLHHNHSALPRYDSSEWDWLRGALATVDRDYGILNKVFHNITDTHIAHHLFSTIPHYHAMEATQAIKPILGEYYPYDDTPIYNAIFREAKECIFVEPDEGDQSNKGIFWFRNKL